MTDQVKLTPIDIEVAQHYELADRVTRNEGDAVIDEVTLCARDLPPFDTTGDDGRPRYGGATAHGYNLAQRITDATGGRITAQVSVQVSHPKVDAGVARVYELATYGFERDGDRQCWCVTLVSRRELTA